MVSFQRSSWSPFACSSFSNSFSSPNSDPHEAYAYPPKDYSNELPPRSVSQALDFSHLPPFEAVANQFQSIGIQFEGAIALRPSNPIFWTHQRGIVLMPAAGRQSVRILFQQPVNQVCISVMGIREVKMVATTEGDRSPIIQRSPTPKRAFRNPNDLLEPLMPHHLELNGELSTDIRLESSRPFVITAFLFGFTQAL